jgi:hypothetical protein
MRKKSFDDLREIFEQAELGLLGFAERRNTLSDLRIISELIDDVGDQMNAIGLEFLFGTEYEDFTVAFTTNGFEASGGPDNPFYRLVSIADAVLFRTVGEDEVLVSVGFMDPFKRKGESE